MKCSVCGKEISEKQGRSHEVQVDQQRLATCSEECRQKARKDPKRARTSYETVTELIPMI